jgi:hypothetical protein
MSAGSVVQRIHLYLSTFVHHVLVESLVKVVLVGIRSAAGAINRDYILSVKNIGDPCLDGVAEFPDLEILVEPDIHVAAGRHALGIFLGILALS